MEVGSEKKQIYAGMLLSYAVVFSKIASGLLYTPIILKQLGIEEYGVYSLCISFLGYLTIFDAGMNAAFIHFYVQRKELENDKVAELNGTFAKVYIILAFLSLCVGMLIYRYAEVIFGKRVGAEEYSILKNAFFFIAILAFLTVINNMFSSLIISNEKFVYGKIINLIEILVTPVISVPFLYSGYGTATLIEIKVVLLLFILGLNALYCFKRLDVSFEFNGHDREMVKRISVFAGLIFIQAIVEQINWQVDKLILVRIKGTEQVSIYSIGTIFNSYFITIAAAITGVFTPRINSLAALKKEDDISGLFVSVSRILSVIVYFIILSFIIFGRQFIMRWAGTEYEFSYGIGLLNMLPCVVPLVMGLGLDITRAKNLHKNQILLGVAVSVGNLLLSIPLARKYGALGCAAGTFIAELIIDVIIRSLYYLKIVHLNVTECYKEQFKLVIVMTPAVIYGAFINIIGVLKPDYRSIATCAVPFVVIYGAAMWFWFLNDVEKNKIRSMLRNKEVA